MMLSKRVHISFPLLSLIVICLSLMTPSLGAFPGYKISAIKSTPTGYLGQLDLISAGPYGQDVQTLSLEVTYYSATTFRLKLTDAAKARWEVPWVVNLNPPTTAPKSTDYTLSFPAVGSPFSFEVARTSTKEVLFNTNPSGQSFNGLIYDDLYLELSTALPSNPNIYGIGERVAAFRLQPGTTYTLLAKDQGTPVLKNLYGSHPFYLDVRPSGQSHGVFLLNSNPMDVVLGNNALTYKVTGGVLDLWFFSGPSPNSVVQQYHQVIGTPVLPAYWHLGWHQCRWGYTGTADTANVVAQYAKNNIPLDTMWNDIDYMDNYKDFTLGSNFAPADQQKFLTQLHDNGQHYVMIVDPGIANVNGYAPYESGLQQNVFIKNAAGENIIGKVWPGLVVFPDFLNLATHDWWFQQVAAFHENGMPFDGLWIDMNEPSNFCDGQCAIDEDGKEITKRSLKQGGSKKIKVKASPYNYENPPYVPGGERMDDKTLNLTATQNVSGVAVPMYNTHNLYGWSEGMATKTALEKVRSKRALVISRSTYPGTGTRHGHWLGDNNSAWADLYYSIPGILSMNMFGIPLVGADICGFGEDTTEELCSRWMQLGTLYPFSRNHNTVGARSQEPYAFGPMLLNASKIALNLRYSLLPYYYTQFYKVHNFGGSFWRPLFFEFPTDASLFGLDKQFMVGPALLVTPVLEQGATTVQGYLPAEYWYDYYTGVAAGNPKQGTTVTLNAPISSSIPIHIRGGHVVPTQRGALTTTVGRTTPFTIIAALNGKGVASGNLFLDDGDSLTTIADKAYSLIHYTVSNNTLTGTVIDNGYVPAETLVVEAIVVYGVTATVTTVNVNGKAVPFKYDAVVRKLSVSGLGSFTMEKTATVNWA